MCPAIDNSLYPRVNTRIESVGNLHGHPLVYRLCVLNLSRSGILLASSISTPFRMYQQLDIILDPYCDRFSVPFVTDGRIVRVATENRPEQWEFAHIFAIRLTEPINGPWRQYLVDLLRSA